jgi:magnesium-transporting ATPase (P-type)
MTGDIIYLENNDEIPCDAVLLSSSDPDGLCFIQTANLDGETDYKARQAIQQTASLATDQVLSEFSGVVECAPPNAEIYRFDSRIKLERHSEYFALTDKQLLLQATHLKNTDWVYAMVVYAGNETKLGKNKQKPPLKWTKQDQFINKITVSRVCMLARLTI